MENEKNYLFAYNKMQTENHDQLKDIISALFYEK